MKLNDNEYFSGVREIEQLAIVDPDAEFKLEPLERGLYIGEMNADGDAHGEGFLKLPGCRFYNGTWKNGLMHGYGKLKTFNIYQFNLGTFGITDIMRQEGEVNDGKWNEEVKLY